MEASQFSDRSGLGADEIRPSFRFIRMTLASAANPRYLLFLISWLERFAARSFAYAFLAKVAARRKG